MLLQTKYEIDLLSEFIFRIRITEGAEIELEDAQAIHAEFVRLATHPKYCVLLDGSTRFDISAEARKLVAGEEYSSRRIALAFVTNSLANTLLGNFFIKINKPKSSVKMFTKETEAINWLNKMLEKYKQE